MASNNQKSEIAGLNKITVAEIGLEKPVLLGLVEQTKGKETAFCRIVGQATGMKSGTSKLGDYVKFSGLFQASNYLTPEIDYRSSKLILPQVASGTLEGMLGSALAEIKGPEGASGAAVVFAFELTVKGDATSAVGYVFGMRSLVKGKDPLEKLFEQLPPVPSLKMISKK